MHFDSVAQKEQQRNFMVWFRRLLQSEPEQVTCQLAGEHEPGNGLTAVRWKTGGYNVTYRVTYNDGFQAVVRFAALGRWLHRTEKVENEAIVIQYLRKHTKIQVSRPLGVGKIALAPYIVEGDRSWFFCGVQDRATEFAISLDSQVGTVFGTVCYHFVTMQ